MWVYPLGHPPSCILTILDQRRDVYVVSENFNNIERVPQEGKKNYFIIDELVRIELK